MFMFFLPSLLLLGKEEADVVSLLSTVPSWRDQAAGLHTLTPAHHTHDAEKSHPLGPCTSVNYYLMLPFLRYTINI